MSRRLLRWGVTARATINVRARGNAVSGGQYEVFVRYPSGATATDAPCQVTHGGGSTQVKVDQTRNAGEWVSLGSYDFSDAAPPASQAGERDLTSTGTQVPLSTIISRPGRQNKTGYVVCTLSGCNRERYRQ